MPPGGALGAHGSVREALLALAACHAVSSGPTVVSFDVARNRAGWHARFPALFVAGAITRSPWCDARIPFRRVGPRTSYMRTREHAKVRFTSCRSVRDAMERLHVQRKNFEKFMLVTGRHAPSVVVMGVDLLQRLVRRVWRKRWDQYTAVHHGADRQRECGSRLRHHREGAARDFCRRRGHVLRSSGTLDFSGTIGVRARCSVRRLLPDPIFECGRWCRRRKKGQRGTRA